MTDSHKIVTTVEPPRALAATRMHPLVSVALSHGEIDPASMRELLAIQREWEAGEAKKAYTAAMVGLKRDLPSILARDKTVAFKDVRYSHTTLAHAVEKIVPVLTAHGFSHSWIPRTADRKVEVTCRLTHSEGHSEECTLDSEPDKSGMKSGAQAIASTITLLQRYSLLALLGIATADQVEADPRAEVDPSTVVDPKTNLRAAAWCVKQGRTREEAEKHIGRKVPQWTGADLEELRRWAPKPTHDPSTGELSPEEEAAIGGAA